MKTRASRRGIRARVWALAVATCVLAFLLGLARTASAETIEAPIGGKPIPLGDARVVCSPFVGGWRAELGGHSVRPPTAVTAVGNAVEVRVATSAADCARATHTVKLLATAPWPSIDLASFTLALDEGRLEGRGHGLHGVLITWPVDLATGADRAADTCRDLKAESGVETCTWGVPKNLTADPTASALRWLPAGAQTGSDVAIYDAEGRIAPPATFAIAPSRVELLDLLPADAALDVSSGIGRAPLKHAEAIAGVDCGTARCSSDSGQLVVMSPPASAATTEVKFRLLPHVFFNRKNPPENQPTVRLNILRCPMTVVSGPALRGLDSARAVVRIEGGCMQDVGSLRFLVGGRQADVTQLESVKGAEFAVVNIGSVDASSVTITAVRGDEGTVVAVARTDTRLPPAVRTVLQIANFPPIDFIPNNRRATVRIPHVADAELYLLSVEDVYDAQYDGPIASVQGDENAVGAVALQFGYRVPTLPSPLDKVDLAILSDALHRNVKEANIPAPFGVTAFGTAPLAEVVCTDENAKPVRVVPGVPLREGFAQREGCRVVIHRERLSPEYGTQKLSLEIEIDKLDGTPRGDAHVQQTLVLRAGNEPRIAWIKGVQAPWDRVVVRLSHVADEGHYLGALEIASGTPAVQWSIIFGTGRARLYATTAIPTGLYRFGTSETSGILSLSLAVISRLTWLDSDGHEGLLGLEAGIMAFSMTGSGTLAGQTLTQVGGVLGIGLSIPIAGAGSVAQASINLHAWVEQRLTGSGSGQAGSPDEAASKQAIIFGPSISVGNVGTNF